MIRPLYCLCLALALFSCRKENTLDCFRANGKFITETRHPGAFRAVTVYDNIDVFIHKAAEHRVEVTSGKNIISDIRTRLTDTSLIIENLNVCNFVRGYKKRTSVHIYTPYLTKLTHMGVGPVRFDHDFRQDVLTIRTESSGDVFVNGTYSLVLTSAHGNGDIHLAGSSRDLHVYTYGTNFLFGEKFEVTGYMYIRTLSLGDVIVNATKLGHLDYHILSHGNVRYNGDPPVIRSLGTAKDAKGRLIKEG